MLNFSPEKLLLVGIIALVVLGPHRLPQAARTLGRFVAEMRRMSASFRSEVGDALAEPRDALTSAVSELGLTDVRQSLNNGFSGLHDGVNNAFLGESATPSTPDPTFTAPPTPAPDHGLPLAPEDPSLN
ncbi:MAG: twin-arginine translocase TatA/TatE family subunit [Acidimicrobiaceae bacterium]|nr:twin-arginine translocase TatA/TatE family subunit [Acidimicrobiaceae bacterium]